MSLEEWDGKEGRLEGGILAILPFFPPSILPIGSL